LAHLQYYMRNVAMGDVSKLGEHTRKLICELNAAGETTNDLIITHGLLIKLVYSLTLHGNGGMCMPYEIIA
jgi:hypothetical protein